MSSETTDPRRAKIAEFEATLRAYMERLGIDDFEISEKLRTDILSAAESRPIEDILALITERVRVRIKAFRAGETVEDDALEMEIEKVPGKATPPKLN